MWTVIFINVGMLISVGRGSSFCPTDEPAMSFLQHSAFHHDVFKHQGPQGDNGLSCKLQLKKMSNNNLLGLEKSKPQNIRYANVCSQGDKQIDMVVTTKGKAYKARPGKNGLKGKMGFINMMKGRNSTSFIFSFVESGTDEAVTIDSMRFSVLDLDCNTGGCDWSKESLTFTGFHSYTLGKDSKLEKSINGDEVILKATEPGDATNDPISTKLSPEQASLGVSIVFTALSSFTLQWGITGKADKSKFRNLFFAGETFDRTKVDLLTKEDKAWNKELTSGQTCSGRSPLGFWKTFEYPHGVYVDVDMSDCKFKSVPALKVSVSGTGDNLARYRGTNTVYLMTEKSFRIYVYSESKTDLIDKVAEKEELIVNWIALVPGVRDPSIGFCSGRNLEWKDYGKYFSSTTDTSSCGFTSTPSYVTCLVGTWNQWILTGPSEVYKPQPKSFPTYLWREDVTMSAAQAKAKKYEMDWLAFDSSKNSGAGYGCGGEVREWKILDQVISFEVDTTRCGFKAIPVYVSSLSGDSHLWQSVGGSAVHNPKPTGFTVYIQSAKKEWKASEYAKKYNWFVTWFAMPASIKSGVTVKK